MNKSEQINELAAALSKAQAQMRPALKDSENPFFKSKYADLESVWEACRKPLTDNGLSISQGGESIEGNKLKISTLLLHSSGQWIESSMETPLVKLDPQSVGSACSYLRRYSLAAMVGITQSDDDGHLATQSKPKESYANTNPIYAAVQQNEARIPTSVSTNRSKPVIHDKSTIVSIPDGVAGTNSINLQSTNKGVQSNEIKKEAAKEEKTKGNVLTKPEVSTVAVKAFVDKNWKATMYAKEVYDKVCEGLRIIKEREKIMYKPLPTLMSAEVVNQQ